MLGRGHVFVIHAEASHQLLLVAETLLRCQVQQHLHVGREVLSLGNRPNALPGLLAPVMLKRLSTS